MLDARCWIKMAAIQHQASSIEAAMLLYIIRHAYAYEHGDPRWPDDSQRPLEAEGAERFRRGMKKLVEGGVKPEVIASSPYVRCRQTADILREELDGRPAVVELEELAPGSDLDGLLHWSRRQKADSVAWVGHSPDVEHLIAALISEGDANVRIAKGTVAAIRIYGELAAGSGELKWLVTLKTLGA
ncbi:MAG TPA: histidine phosphatase family protein [Lacipirellula sp.]